MLDSCNAKMHICDCMQLTQQTDFGLRLLIVLARKGGAVSLPVFAADQRLSYNHVAKVAQRLARHGFVRSRRGRGGGVDLARPPDTITVGEVVRAMEPGMQLADCGRCAIRFDCGTSGYLADALAAFMAVLDNTTLSQAAHPARTSFTLAPPEAEANELSGGIDF
ncbi:Rrf2 family transcriptional regulator [Novosphingobium sp. Gsoil 351]|uniref:RrF2 family transcriptional regulator n=1 Tax=Novosphingobium sp. Gsoil 351 TaxID=2675225 RepID=UPI0012B4F887|nr:Rrf2 family transcriptional regulator [Novosphingobium sp. Gsoil 351]QGN55046.1 Rrf2 family transcriptional regulator [Novosphingobium sp. Gsoil 351]